MLQRPVELAGTTPESGEPLHLRVDVPATVLFFERPTTVPAHLLAIGREGCEILCRGRVPAKPSKRVEICFKIRGIAFRLPGTVQGVREGHRLSILFSSMSQRREQELDELLAELEESARNTPPQSVFDSVVLEERAESLADSATSLGEGSREPASMARSSVAGDFSAARQVAPRSVPATDRRSQSRHTVESCAAIYLVGVLSRSRGIVVDLSFSGCRIRTDDPFPLGIYRRVEVEFVLDGLPFRLPGVTQALHDRFTVGIRFLDVSARKREQLQIVIEELQELHSNSEDNS